jgi:hypothetical protein
VIGDGRGKGYGSWQFCRARRLGLLSSGADTRGPGRWCTLDNVRLLEELLYECPEARSVGDTRRVFPVFFETKSIAESLCLPSCSLAMASLLAACRQETSKSEA